MEDITAARIRARRIELGYTQEELALMVGYKGRSAINKIEKDTRGLQIEKVVEFARALRVSPAYLMGWDEDTDRDTKKTNIQKLYDLLTDDQQKLVNDLIENLLSARKK